MKTIQIEDIQRDPLGYLREVEAGESFVILNAERPIAEIKPIPPATNELRPYGRCKGMFTVPDDFDDPLPEEILRDFEGP